MAYKIVAKKRFLTKLQDITNYVEMEWGVKAAEDFISKVDMRIHSLKSHPYIGAPSHKIPNVRGLHITKHNRMFYKIERETIILINIYDTRRKDY